MQTLQLSNDKALKLYPSAPPEWKQVLEESFGKEFFNQKIVDRVKTFEDACALTGEDPEDEKFKTGTPDEIAYKKLKVITQALNEGKVLSFANSNQKKWRPWFECSGSGFRFDLADSGYTVTDSAGGSRLCFATEELAVYAGTHFIDLYNQLLN